MYFPERYVNGDLSEIKKGKDPEYSRRLPQKSRFYYVLLRVTLCDFFKILLHRVSQRLKQSSTKEKIKTYQS
jgi:hypothetical protein